jgi:plasmid stabilization system protein ParE
MSVSVSPENQARLEEAVRDLDRIVDSIAEDNPAAALAVLSTIISMAPLSWI